MDNSLNAGKENRSAAVVTGKRKQDLGLVVPALAERTKKRNIGRTKKRNILHQELEKKKEKYNDHFE